MSASEASAFLNLDEASFVGAADRGELYALKCRPVEAGSVAAVQPVLAGKLLPHVTEIIDIMEDKGGVSGSTLMATTQSMMVSEGQHNLVEWFKRGGDVVALARSSRLRSGNKACPGSMT